MPKQFERSATFERALKQFDEELVSLQLSSQISVIGDGPVTTTCHLYHSDGSLASMGHGKGFGVQSEVSAKYEALEHLFSCQGSQIKKHCKIFSFSEIHHKLSEYNKKALPTNLLRQENNDKKTAWAFLSGSDQSQLLMPYFLLDTLYLSNPFPFDELDYQSFCDWPSNNGTAIGTSFDEALLHAVNELVERDALSCFLLSSFCREEPKPLRIVDSGCLPSKYRELWDQIESTSRGKIVLCDITTDIGIPVFLAALIHSSFSTPIIGCGASSSVFYALERALLEMLQMIHFGSDDLGSSKAGALERFKEWDKLKKCVLCDLKPLLSHAEKVVLSSDADQYGHLSVPELLEHSKRLLENQGMHIFSIPHYQSSNGITCLKVVIPGLEEFFRVRYGHFVIPGERGQSILGSF